MFLGQYVHINNSSFEQIEIHPFKIPSLRFTAETYVNMIYWETSLITEAPFTKHFSKEIQLKNVCTPVEIQVCPCHTQAVSKELVNWLLKLRVQ